KWDSPLCSRTHRARLGGRSCLFVFGAAEVLSPPEKRCCAALRALQRTALSVPLRGVVVQHESRVQPYPSQTKTTRAVFRQRPAGGLTMMESVHAPRTHMARHSHPCASFYVVLQGSFTETYTARSIEYPTSSIITYPETSFHAVEYHA